MGSGTGLPSQAAGASATGTGADTGMHCDAGEPGFGALPGFAGKDTPFSHKPPPDFNNSLPLQTHHDVS